MTLPVLVQPGWQESVFIPNGDPLTSYHHGPFYYVLFYEDGTARFEHRCDRGDRGVVVCAPMLQIGNGHTIEQRDPLTISPSILCHDCGTHGFIRNGRWVRNTS